jgi:two-component system phosphate regulon response regulator PhoB/two-component system alkaline phosphatase synthesis response regulator PhoP/two-component system response regulator VicR
VSNKCNVKTAYNGKEGYEQIEKRKLDIIILNVLMATETEGFDLAYTLKNKPEYRNIPIVLVTGFTQRMADLRPERFQHIFGKDWAAPQMFEKATHPEELLAAVEGLLKEQTKWNRTNRGCRASGRMRLTRLALD